MKVLITSFNKKLGLNPIVARLFDPLPEFERAGVHDCEAVFLSFIAPEHDFEPDKMLLDAMSRRKLPVVIFDHSETFPENFILGYYPLPPESPYAVLQSMIGTELQVRAYFKRELTTNWITNGNYAAFNFQVHSLDWTLNPFFGDPLVHTREEYNARPIDIFFSWGYSNESRPKLMGELLRQAGKFSAHWCLTEEDLDRALDERRERIFALLFTPWYRRIHIKKLMTWQQQAKISVSMFGAGKKCFRNCEASYNSLMAQQAPDELQWSFPWKSGENCFQLPSGGRFLQDRFYEEEDVAVGWLYSALRVEQGANYDIYVKGVENSKHYQNTNYARNYIFPKLKEALK